MMLINLTDHPITMQRPDYKTISIVPSGTEARVESDPIVVEVVSSIPIIFHQEKRIVGLPAPKKGTLYITSTIVAIAAADQGRSDVISPDEDRNRFMTFRLPGSPVPPIKHEPKPENGNFTTK